MALSAIRKGNGSERDLFNLIKALELLYIAVSERPDYFVAPASGLQNIRMMAMGIYQAIERGRSSETDTLENRWSLSSFVFLLSK